MPRLNYVNGVNLSTMIKISRFTFGNDSVIKGEKDNDNFTFIIYIKNVNNDELINLFENYWKVKIKVVD